MRNKEGGDMGDKFCGQHLQPEFFPITYYFCPYCGEELELVPKLKKLREKFEAVQAELVKKFMEAESAKSSE